MFKTYSQTQTCPHHQGPEAYAKGLVELQFEHHPSVPKAYATGWLWNLAALCLCSLKEDLKHTLEVSPGD